MIQQSSPHASGADPFVPDLPGSPPVRGLTCAGLAVAFAFFGGFGAWASLAPLSSASMAQGIVKVESNRKTVQHLEGGIIEAILVREGDAVRAGQALLRLDDIDATADEGALAGQRDALMAREARLIAQQNGSAGIAFPADLEARRMEAAVGTILEGQQRIFQDQARVLAAETAVWRQRVEQHRSQIDSIRAETVSLEQQLPSLRDEFETARGLLERGLERRPRVQALEREVAGIEGEIVANSARVTALEQQIAEAEMQVEALREKRLEETSQELREVQTRAAELQEQLRKTSARVGRKEIVAPQDGVVVDLRYFTPGGVVAPGAPILDIVPAEDRLVIEARVSPLDIDSVRPDLPAVVRLVAYKQRSTPTLEGRVGRVSADAFTDERSGEVYFTSVIELSDGELERVPEAALYPGMPIEVAIVTGERSFVDYLLQPLSDSFSHAFREE